MTTIRNATTAPVAERVGLDPRAGMALSVGLLLLTAAFPVVGVIAIVVALAVSSRRPAVIGSSVVFVVAALLAWVNTSKNITNDWGWYVEHYRVLQHAPLEEYLGTQVGAVTAKPTEPLYYVLAQAVSVATGASVSALAVAITVTIYALVGAAIVAAVASATDRPSAILVGTFAALTMGLTFTLTTQLVRQEIAAALIAVAVILAARRRWVWMALAMLAAGLVHNAAFAPAIAIVVATVLQNRRRSRLLLMLLTAAAFIGIGRLSLEGSGRAANDGSISPLVIGLDLAVLVAFLITCRRTELGANPIARTVMMCLPAFYGLVIGVAAQPIPLLRMYFFIEVLRALMIALICATLIRGRWAHVLGAGVVLAACAYFALRLAQSPFIYTTLPLDIILWSPVAAFMP